jgi:hypothetical protein
MKNCNIQYLLFPFLVITNVHSYLCLCFTNFTLPPFPLSSPSWVHSWVIQPTCIDMFVSIACVSCTAARATLSNIVHTHQKVYAVMGLSRVFVPIAALLFYVVITTIPIVMASVPTISTPSSSTPQTNDVDQPPPTVSPGCPLSSSASPTSSPAQKTMPPSPNTVLPPPYLTDTSGSILSEWFTSHTKYIRDFSGVHKGTPAMIPNVEQFMTNYWQHQPITFYGYNFSFSHSYSSAVHLIAVGSYMCSNHFNSSIRSLDDVRMIYSFSQSAYEIDEPNLVPVFIFHSHYYVTQLGVSIICTIIGWYG